MSNYFQTFTNYIKSFFIGQIPIVQNTITENTIEKPHFIIERIIDSNITIGIGSLYENSEGKELLKFDDTYLELIDFSKNQENNELHYHFANDNKYFKLIITKNDKIPQFSKKNLLEYKLINMQAMFYNVIVAGTIHKITMKPIGMDISKNIDEIATLFQ
jgi:hypothetical protein